MTQQITEEMNIHQAWYDEANQVTVESLPNFIKKLTTEYGHDYGTICHAITAAAVAAAHAVNKSPAACGGITGFQAGAVMWEFLRAWNHVEGPARLIDYNDLLYPQMESKFRSISHETWRHIRNKACELLSEKTEYSTHPEVTAHWQSIAAGIVPFGLQVSEH